MSDDGFVFDDDTDDESALFGTSSEESDSESASETDRRFGTTTTDATGSRSFVRRMRAMASDATIRTAATVALAVVLVIASGLVAYPLVMDTLDTTDSPTGGAEPTTDGDAGFVGSTEPSPTARMTSATISERPTGTTTITTSETTTLTMTTTALPSTASPTPTEQTPTAVPTHGFPAGEPVDETETNTSA